jgi:hypothetical protein
MNFRLTKTKLIVCIILLLLSSLLILLTLSSVLCIGSVSCLSGLSDVFGIPGLISLGLGFLVGLIIYVIWSLFQKKTNSSIKADKEENA